GAKGEAAAALVRPLGTPGRGADPGRRGRRRPRGDPRPRGRRSALLPAPGPAVGSRIFTTETRRHGEGTERTEGNCPRNTRIDAKRGISLLFSRPSACFAGNPRSL